MERKTLRGGNLSSATYDAAERRLEIDHLNGERRTYNNVPVEVWRRLIAAPNPASYVEDRIEEEYPVKRSRVTGSGPARSKLDDLFGTQGDAGQ